MLIQGNKVLSKYDKPLLLGTATANRQVTPASVINEEYVKRRPNLGQKKALRKQLIDDELSLWELEFVWKSFLSGKI